MTGPYFNPYTMSYSVEQNNDQFEVVHTPEEKRAKEMTDAEKDREIAEWMGICWHETIEWKREKDPMKMVHVHGCDDTLIYTCSCGKKSSFDVCPDNPNFTADPLRLLAEMRKREDWNDLIFDLVDNFPGEEEGFSITHFTDILLIPGALRDVVWEWMKGRKG